MNRIREMESLNSFLGEDQLPHSRESNYQIVTWMEVDVNKKMLRVQEEKAKRIISSFHNEYTLKIKGFYCNVG